MGYTACATSAAFRETLALFGYGSPADGLVKLSPQTIAQLLVRMGETQEGLVDSFVPLHSER